MLRQYYSPFPLFPVSPFSPYGYYNPYIYSPFYSYGGYQQPVATVVSGGLPTSSTIIYVPLHFEH